METVQSSLNYKINALKETWVGAAQEMIDRGDLGNIISGLTKLSEGITFLVDKLGLLKTAVLAITAIQSAKGHGEYTIKFQW